MWDDHIRVIKMIDFNRKDKPNKEQKSWKKDNKKKEKEIKPFIFKTSINLFYSSMQFDCI